MNAHVAKDSFDIVLPGLSRESLAREDRKRRPSLASRLAGAVQWLTEMPRRRALLNELSALSDHELADIGLSRADLPRVFDPTFARQRACARNAGN
jgi:uncharacterized protein YjiS (DUF1127 family)